MGIAVALLVPGGATAVLTCAALAAVAGGVIYSSKDSRTFLLRIFVSGLLARMFVGTLIYAFKMQEFFGGDALTYDFYGNAQLQLWQGEMFYRAFITEWVSAGGTGWGMLYIVAGIYGLVGRNMLAVQFFNAVVGRGDGSGRLSVRAAHLPESAGGAADGVLRGVLPVV